MSGVRSRREEEQLTRGRRPPWLRVRAPTSDNTRRLQALLRGHRLHTVCEEAACPNIGECWGQGTATFLLLGEICTRNCGFCNVKTGRPQPLDEDEPRRVAETVALMELRHAVLTSVTRDDLPDGGASIFARTVQEARRSLPDCTVEVLIPDFGGDRAALRLVMDADPDILNHNLETVPRLYPAVRPLADYERSLHVLRWAKEMNPEGLTKSGLMLGLGERWDELLAVMDDLRSVGCDILTLGQYLQPSRYHLPIARYYTPEEFAQLRAAGEARGFAWVEAGPLVRSSYHAEQQATALKCT
ncbi:MAG: lipoyl synthase [Chloroflexi bacterium]|nr:lipoyl synthase [Chloroflexota bacterium]